MQPGSGTVDVLNSGTTMRIFAGIASLFSVPVTITGDESIMRRPMGPLLDALTSMGVSCVSRNGFPPVTITGPNRGGDVRIDGSVSSQFVSSMCWRPYDGEGRMHTRGRRPRLCTIRQYNRIHNQEIRRRRQESRDLMRSVTGDTVPATTRCLRTSPPQRSPLWPAPWEAE